MQRIKSIDYKLYVKENIRSLPWHNRFIVKVGNSTAIHYIRFYKVKDTEINDNFGLLLLLMVHL